MPVVALERALRDAAARDPDRPAITDAGRTFSRADVDLLVDRGARRLLGDGVAHGDLVALSGTNSAELLMAVFAIWRVGAVPVPLHPRKGRDELVDLVLTSAAKVAIGFPADHAEAWPGVATPTLAELFDGDDVTPVPEAPVAPRLRIGSSGGSTGPSKLISVDVPAITNPARPWHYGLRADGVHVVPLEVCDGTGFVATTVALAIGCHQVLMREFDATELLRLVAEHRVDWIAATHPVLVALAKLPASARRRHDVSSLRCVTQYSGAIPVWAKRELIDWLGPERLAESYGATDARGSCWIDGVEWLAHPGSVGRAAPGCEIAVFDETGRRLPPGEVGLVYLRDLTGRRNFHYLNAEVTTLDGGWETFGDLGRLEDDGYLYLVDRVKDMIHTADGPVAPLPIEGALERHRNVRSAVVIGLPGPDGDRVHALVDTAGHEVSDDELRTMLHDLFPEVRVPDTWEHVDLPLRDMAGKAQRLRLRASRL
ncbi:acyl-CoA synthetase family protein [Jatrophihabitans fulvus]